MISVRKKALITVIMLTFGGFSTGVLASDESRDLGCDTWVATDALGRKVAGVAETGPPRQGKVVGMFYFLWLGQSGDLGPFDISRILAQDPRALTNPASSLWGPMYSPHHWGESIFGYYVADDESVLRKHAQMLANAGVDALFFDVTNQLTYPQSWKALCRVFDQSRRQGNRVPRIAFLCPFGDPRKVVHELWATLYAPRLYPDLWFPWEGKPLILADPALLHEDVVQDQRSTAVELTPGHTLGQIFTVDRPFLAVGGALPTWSTSRSAVTLTLFRQDGKGEPLASRRCTRLRDSAWEMLQFDDPQPPGTYRLEISRPEGHVGWWTSDRDVWPHGQALSDGSPTAGDRTLKIRVQDAIDSQIQRFFTFRKPQPDYFAGPTGPRQWGWLEVYPQHAFYARAGVPEEVTVGAAVNAVDGKLGVLSHPRSQGRSFHDGRQPGPEGQDDSGRNFAEQWRRAFQLDPSFVFVTGWNEWIAGRFDHTFPLAGAGRVTFCDEFNQEYSRDIEPMKGGHGDDYYYQLVSMVRHFKGTRPVPPVASRPIQIDGRFDDWTKVGPEYRDTIGDPVHRDHSGWGKTLHYRNTTGRNDIVAAKVSFDRDTVCFYVQTREKLTAASDPSWMLLFINADADSRTGWLGYDLVINRRRTPEGKALIEKNVAGRYEWTVVAEAPFARDSNQLELAVPNSAIGFPRTPAEFNFKWADNLQQTGDWSDFTLNGDSAPDDRFNYHAVAAGSSR